MSAGANSFVYAWDGSLLGAIPADSRDAEAALGRGACVVVYPGGDLEACRPWSERNRINFGGRKGFVRLALRCGIPVVPVVAHGGQHAVVVLSRGDRLARAAGLHRLRIKVFPFLAGPPFGITSVLTPPLPMPAQLTVEFLPALDWSRYGPDAADDSEAVSACYEDITGRMQAALDRLDVVGGREPEHLAVEGQLGFQRRHHRVGLAEPVRLAFEREVGVPDALSREVSRDALGLLRRHDGVVQPLQQQYRAGIGVHVA